MLSSLLKGSSKVRTQVVAIDLGQRTTKAVSVQRKGEGFELLQYHLEDAPVFEKAPSPELIGDHLRAVNDVMKLRGKPVVLIIGVNESVVRNAEVPIMGVDELRLMLKYNSKTYLQQDLPDHSFDAFILSLASQAKPGEAKAPDAPKGPMKIRAVVGGAKRQILANYQDAAKQAGLSLAQIIPSVICPPNAFEIALPEQFKKDILALVDVGFKASSISLLAGGELLLTRVLSFGGDHLTQGLVESMGVSYAEAEGIKIAGPEEVQGMLQPLVMSLASQIRATLDFFEHQQNQQVSQVYVSGGSARSQFIVDSLQAELMVPTKAWNPTASFTLSLPPEKLGEVEQIASQLTVALGGAIAAL